MTGSATPTVLATFVALLVVLPIVAFVSRRLRVPYTVILVLVGLVVSGLPVRDEIQVSPGLAVSLLLPGLVFEAAYRLDYDELRRTFGGVALLAVPGVIVSAVVVAVVLHLATGLPTNGAFLVGAMVSATDPVAVVATMRGLNAPRRLVTLVDAESLFNDGTAMLVVAVALGTFQGPRTLADDALAFAVALIVSVAIGVVGGWLTARLAALTEDHLIELTLTLLAAYGSYLVADLAHGSGIIGTVVAGIVMGTYGRRVGLSPRAQEAIDEVWTFLAFIFTAAAFLLIGLAVPLAGLADAAVASAWGVVAVLAGRALVIYCLLGGTAALARRVGLAPPLPLSWLHVLNWAGLRGAVAMTLAVAMPADVPERATLQGITFGIVLFTVIVQGATADLVARRTGVAQAPPERPLALAADPLGLDD
jgi:CPA1 family monovalent cation:H+ antiporter